MMETPAPVRLRQRRTLPLPLPLLDPTYHTLLNQPGNPFHSLPPPAPGPTPTPASIRYLHAAFQATPDTLRRLERGWREQRKTSAAAALSHMQPAQTLRHAFKAKKNPKPVRPERPEPDPEGSSPAMSNAGPTPPTAKHPRRLQPPVGSPSSPDTSRPSTAIPMTSLRSPVVRQRVHFSPSVSSREAKTGREGKGPRSGSAVVSFSGLPTPPASPSSTEAGPGAKTSGILTADVIEHRPACTSRKESAIRTHRGSERVGEGSGTSEGTPQADCSIQHRHATHHGLRPRDEGEDIVAKLYLPAGRLIVAFARAPTITLSFSSPSGPASSEGSGRTKVRVRLRSAEGELRIDTSTSSLATSIYRIPTTDQGVRPAKSTKFRSKRIMPLFESGPRASIVQDGEGWCVKLQEVLGEAEQSGTWLKEEVEGLNRMLSLRDEWIRYLAIQKAVTAS